MTTLDEKLNQKIEQVREAETAIKTLFKKRIAMLLEIGRLTESSDQKSFFFLRLNFDYMRNLALNNHEFKMPDTSRKIDKL